MSNPDSLVIMIGNPSTRDSAFFDAFHSQKHMWHGLHWNAEETPASKWFSPERNTMIADEFGIDSDMYRISVLGEFPKVDPDCLFSEEMLQPCHDKARIAQAAVMPRGGIAGESIPRQFGIDLARQGGDDSVIFRRQGMAVAQWQAFSNKEPQDIIETAFRWQREVGWHDEDVWYVPDATGMGQAILFNFTQSSKQCFPFRFGSSAGNRAKFANLETEAWFHLRHLVRQFPVYIPYDKQLVQQLVTRRYYARPDGSLIIEPKREYTKRHGSPDRADALIMAFYDRHASDGRTSSLIQSPRTVGMEVRL